jgi:NO-binding membrane sensor protein with MHYT domain
MLNISWDPVLIAISYLVAFIASFVALDSAGKIPFPAERLPCSGALPGV